ncbi:protein NRT1/ PTR FAMILY 3.1-like [Aristolochia californica]|uniref:protein NRT1/ PTR FAMILY 3.1-like n=1 Tax=Aristolochia californica TaxID=171875 RepID=UPI0035E0CA05
MAQDGKEEEKKKKVGGFRTIPFILANEFCDRFATTGFQANMITYLTQELHMALVPASNTLTNFTGMASLTPIVGAVIADSFAGRFWTITVGSIIYQLGMISLTLSAVLPALRPPPCAPHQTCLGASAWQVGALYVSLFFTSLGSGGIRPCVVAFGADQFELYSSRSSMKTSNYFNWYYFSMGIATLLALTVVVYIQDNVGWGWGLGLPTIAMAISVVAFVIGYPLYRCLKPGGSPLTRLLQVVVAAFRKRKTTRPTDSSLLYENRELDANISATGRLLHTDQFKFFDRAAIVTPGDNYESGHPNLWKISTVHRVEELKSITRMLPIWSVGILIASSSHQSTFAIQQARSMDRHLTRSFQIPPASMSIFTILTLLIGIVLYDRVFVPTVRRFTKNPAGISYLLRMGIGLAIAVLATVISALVEIKRKSVASAHDLIHQPQSIIPISVFWLVPQYCLHGLAEAFMSVGHLEFLYDQSPESMRSTAAALFWLAISAGSYLNTLVVSLVHKYTGKDRNWLPDRNLNEGRLECYYWLVTGLQVLNLVYYMACAWFYTYKPLEVLGPESPQKQTNGGDLEGQIQLSRTEACKDVEKDEVVS